MAYPARRPPVDRPIFCKLDQECDARGLHLELHVSSKLHGLELDQWRKLERIDITTAGRQCMLSVLIVPGPPCPLEAAAEIVLERLTTAAA